MLNILILGGCGARGWDWTAVGRPWYWYGPVLREDRGYDEPGPRPARGDTWTSVLVCQTGGLISCGPLCTDGGCSLGLQVHERIDIFFPIFCDGFK